jgi:transposase InsO family protein
MDLRLRFIADWQTEHWTMTELCTDYQISRKTGYKWTARYETAGPAGLYDRSRRPQGCAHATDPDLVAALVALRAQHPLWGPRKLLAILSTRAPAAAWPSRSTAAALLKRRGLVVGRRRRVRPAAPRVPLGPVTAANEVWTTDFKGEFRTGDRLYCYPLTLRDGWSRFVLRCDALVTRTSDATRHCFARAFATYGLPARIRSDNGGPFASPGLGGLSRLAVWWMRLGIVPERIAPGHPEQNGSHEQFHAVLSAHTARPPAAHAAAQQRRFARFCHEYNYDRPHEALGDGVPASRYQPSPRPLPPRLPALEYPGHVEVRRVATNGCVSWRARPVFLAEALAGEWVGFEAVDDGLWTVRFGLVALGRFDERHHRIDPIASLTAGRSASATGSAPHPTNP